MTLTNRCSPSVHRELVRPIVYCANVYIVQMCIFLFMYIVNFSYIVACTFLAQSLVPKNFTIRTLVYMLCDNKEIWFDNVLFKQIVTKYIRIAFSKECNMLYIKMSH